MCGSESVRVVGRLYSLREKLRFVHLAGVFNMRSNPYCVTGLRNCENPLVQDADSRKSAVLCSTGGCVTRNSEGVALRSSVFPLSTVIVVLLDAGLKRGISSV
jgi:hypothetical protein